MRRRRVSFSPDPRRTALKRAAIAVVAALVLLLGVLWFGSNEKQPSSQSDDAQAQTSSPSADTAPATATPSATDTAPIADSVPVPDVAPPVTPTQTVTEAVPRTEEKTRPPTLETHEAQQPPAIPPKTQKQTASSPGNKTPSAPLMADTPPATHSTLPAPLTNGYYVQLGVFDATDNTNRLLENASALGLPAHVQSRVLVGPFRNKREAEAARSRLKELAKGIVVRPQKTAKAPNKPPAKSRRRARQTVGEQK